MKKICKCSLCGAEFSYAERGDCYIEDCFKHEVLDHLKGDKVCKGIIKDTINDLNQKYKIEFTMIDYRFNPYYSDYGMEENSIEISFRLKGISTEYVELYIKCVNNEFTLTKEMLIKELNKYYVEATSESYVGVVRFEDWCGGHGADDYIINGMYIRDIMKRLEGKKISIQVLKD